MEARWRVVFIGVKLVGGAELAAPVEKTVVGLERTVPALVEKAAGTLEKVAAGQRHGGERRRQAAMLGHDGEEG
jgi:hypothetical protein